MCIRDRDYSAHPDRVFLVRTDGRLAVAAGRGPRGFGPGLNDVADWLADLKESGEEPELSSDAIEKADRATEARLAKLQKATLSQIPKVAGDWTVNNISDDGEISSIVTLSAGESSALGSAKVGDSEIELEQIRFNGQFLSFSFTKDDTKGRFTGELADDVLTGELTFGDSTYKSNWERAKSP